MLPLVVPDDDLESLTQWPWYFVTASFRVNHHTDTLSCTLSVNNEIDSTVVQWPLSLVEQSLFSLDVSAVDYRWLLMSSSENDHTDTEGTTSVHGLVDEMRVFTGPLTSAQVTSLQQANLASAASSMLIPGRSYTYDVQSTTSTIAFNTTDMNVGQSSPVFVPPEIDGVTLLPNEIEGEKEVLSGRQVVVTGTITVHALDFTFEEERLTVGIWPGDVEVRCQDESLDSTGMRQPRRCWPTMRAKALAMISLRSQPSMSLKTRSHQVSALYFWNSAVHRTSSTLSCVVLMWCSPC